MKSIKTIIIILLLCPIIVNAKSNYLYDIIEDEAKNNGLAREYTGNHNDSYTKEPSKKIYHWYALTSSEADQILNKNNVIFANHCWQILRTTDTGGVKLIYNGEVENNQCLNDRGQHTGYTDRFLISMSGSYYYGTDFEYDETTQKFKLKGDIKQIAWTEPDKDSVVQKYTCKSNDSEYQCSTLYYIDGITPNRKSAFAMYIDHKSPYYQIGDLPYNYYSSSPADVGYMYNNRYTFEHRSLLKNTNVTSIRQSNSYNFWFSDNIIWNSDTSKWELVNPTKYTSSVEKETLIGKYTFFSTTEGHSSSHVDYIAYTSQNNFHYVIIQGEKNLNEVIDYYSYGNDYIENNDGTYTILNPTSFSTLEWQQNSGNIIDKFMCKNVENNKCTDLVFVKKAYDSYYLSLEISKKIKYGNSFVYNNGQYTLTGQTYEFWDVYNTNNTSKLVNAHYTCFNSEGTCTDLKYIIRLSPSSNPFDYKMDVITINDGKTITEEINEMLYNDDVNKYDSIMKMGIDNWYRRHLLNYSDYIEDVIFCNNRSLYSMGMFNPNGGSLSITSTSFKGGFTCENEVDQFSVSNPKAKLTYPIGLATMSELVFLNNSNLIKTGTAYWTATPNSIGTEHVYMTSVQASGATNRSPATDNDNYGIRPSISLIPNIRVSSGEGSKDNPYIIGDNPYYNIDIIIKNETKDLDVELNDLTNVLSGEEVKFKVTPIKGYKVTGIEIIERSGKLVNFSKTSNKNEYKFTMPEDNVTIIPSYEKVSNAVNVDNNDHTKEIKIEVNDATAVVYEDEVIFRVNPEEGYELVKIEIIDEEGNQIDYRKTDNDNEYSFVMPDVDVTIKPIYKKLETNDNNNNIIPINPKTGASLISLVLLLAIFGISMFIVNRKSKFLRD